MTAEISDGLYRIVAPLGNRFASVYVVRGSRGALLFDTGVAGTIGASVLPALAQFGIAPSEIRTVVLSHCDVDHFGGVGDARETFPGAAILAHPLDRPAIEDFDVYLADRARQFRAGFGWDEDPAVLEWCRSVTREAPVDDDALDGRVVDLGDREAVILHVPGHSLGHTAISVPWAGAVLVSDAVLGASVNLADGTPAFPPTYRYVDDYLATIARLEAAGDDRLLTAHYPEFRGHAAKDFLASSRSFVERLDALVLEALGQAAAGLTLHELLAALNPIAGDWPADGTEGALAFPVVGHLERGVEAGRIRQAGSRDSVPVWSV